MESNPVHGRAKDLATIVTLGCVVLGVLVPLAFGILDVLNKPALTYEHSSHSLPAQKSMISIILRNEGRASAEEVEVKVRVNGEIENVSVLERDIAGKIPVFEFFGEPVGIDIKDSSSIIITIPYIPERMKYITDLIIKPQDDELIKTLIVHSKNGGLAEKYIEKGGLALTWLAWGFAAGVILTVASVFLRKSFRRYRQKRQEDPGETELKE